MFPILFTIPKVLGFGPFPIHSFGVMIVIAFFVGLWLCQRRASRYDIAKPQVSDVCFYALIGGVLGARLFFILQELPDFLKHPEKLFTLRFEGMTSFGGPIVGFLVVWFWARRSGKPLANVLDLLAPGFIIGHAVGRFGCVLNGCCFGGVCPVGSPLGIKVAGDTHLHYPAQVYDSAMNLAALGILLWIESKGQRAYVVTSIALILHGATRFIYEFWRAGTVEQVNQGLASSTYWGSLPITQAQAMALGVIVLGIATLVLTKPKPAPTAEAV